MGLLPRYSLLWEQETHQEIFDCVFKLNSGAADDTLTHVTLDLILSNATITSRASSAKRGLFIYLENESSESSHLRDDIPAVNFLQQILVDRKRDRAKSDLTEVIIKLVLSKHDGYIVRSDFLEHRMQGFENAVKIKSFTAPREQIKASTQKNLQSAEDLIELLPQAIGALSIVTHGHDLRNVLQVTEDELVNRISFSWLSSTLIPEKRIAWVEGRPDYEFSRRMYEAAWALGITLVLIDNPGHWMEMNEGPHTYLREAFIPVNISVDDGFVDRIVNAVRRYDKPIHSIISVSDARVIGVAKACEILGFPTSSSDAYVLAADKYKTRLSELDTNGSFKVDSIEELKAALAQRSNQLEYPLVAKPCMGWGSECISKVTNEAELVQAVEKASARHATSPQRRTDVMIEPFIDGPEVDANFVLLDSKILFYEIADDFPSPGDDPKSSWEANFQETANLLPCGLPSDELIIVRDSIHQSLLRQGFHSGTFHCEGRVRYSTLCFETRDGREDLYPVAESKSIKRQAEFYLHEINARPAGYLESVATHLTYGVDYYALQLLYSLGDTERYRALSHPFLNGPQWWLVLLIIPEDRAGTMKTADAGKELLARDPILATAVPDYKTVQKKGGKLGGPKASALSYLAYFSVISRKSRSDALDLADRTRKGFIYELEED